ncbi:flagellar motor switch protein FliN [Catenuloplanes indicus]|uniref:Flagellar motor switch protein FliN/FliY n=1 Tax=Catenuloplanes indicus TaxID=137267 RepID=A0AAE4B1T7_9ACTN|nr:flagellar motor switch protein FliN [Catenuloplanes indicus]MDQ0368223.1 flagellar motor switch protein FliN/FliY [Catenuloplanes indicus]
MTAATVTDSQLTLARSAAQAALAVLPTSTPLQAGQPVSGAIADLPDGQAITARFSGAATGEVVVIVGADLADALRTSPLGELDLATAVRPALEGAARAFGPVVLDPGQVMEPAVAMSALTVKGDMTVSVPLLEGGETRAVVAVLLSPWPSEGGDVAPRATAPATAVRAGLEMLHDVEMEVSAELGRTRMSVRDLLSVTPGTIVELDRAAGSPADLLVNGRLIARGEVVVIDENFGIRITEIMTPNE